MTLHKSPTAPRLAKPLSVQGGRPAHADKGVPGKRRAGFFRFRLYVAGGTQNSAQAVVNLTGLCRTYLPERHSIEVVDVFREPKRAAADGVFMTPTLLKLAPAPIARIVGTLSGTDTVLQTLGLEGIPR